MNTNEDGLVPIIQLDDYAERDRRFEGAFTLASNVTPRSPEWFWGQRLVRNDLNIIAGEQGLGKSQFGTYLAANLSRQSEDDYVRNALILTAEEDADTIVVPRLIAYGAQLPHVAILRDDISLTLTPEHLPTLADSIETFGAEFCVVDPVSAFIDSKTDSYKDPDVRAMLRSLRAIAHTLRCTFLLVMHTKKGQERVAVNMVGGSIAWTAAPRSVLIMTRDKDGDPTTDRILWHPKCNVGPEQGPLACTIEPIERGMLGNFETSVLHFTGDADTDGGLDEAMGHAPKAPSKFDNACRWLREELSRGPNSASDIESRAQAEGINDRTLRRAKEKVATSEKSASGWVWRLSS